MQMYLKFIVYGSLFSSSLFTVLFSGFPFPFLSPERRMRPLGGTKSGLQSVRLSGSQAGLSSTHPTVHRALSLVKRVLCAIRDSPRR